MAGLHEHFGRRRNSYIDHRLHLHEVRTWASATQDSALARPYYERGFAPRFAPASPIASPPLRPSPTRGVRAALAVGAWWGGLGRVPVEGPSSGRAHCWCEVANPRLERLGAVGVTEPLRCFESGPTIAGD